LTAVPAVVAAQAMPTNGAAGTVALEGTVDQEYRAANALIVKTEDGVKHVFHFSKDLLVHGGGVFMTDLKIAMTRHRIQW
jgi:hypothetical protein